MGQNTSTSKQKNSNSTTVYQKPKVYNSRETEKPTKVYHPRAKTVIYLDGTVESLDSKTKSTIKQPVPAKQSSTQANYISEKKDNKVDDTNNNADQLLVNTLIMQNVLLNTIDIDDNKPSGCASDNNVHHPSSSISNNPSPSYDHHHHHSTYTPNYDHHSNNSTYSAPSYDHHSNNSTYSAPSYDYSSNHSTHSYDHSSSFSTPNYDCGSSASAPSFDSSSNF